MKNNELLNHSMSDLADPTDLYDQYLSFLDLEKHPDWDKAWKSQNQKAVEDILFSLGCDIKHGYEITVCLHRARTSNQVEYGPRVAFKERTDPNYVRNYMSVEDIIRTTSDKSLRDEMNQMSKRQGLGLHIKNNVKDEDE